MKIDKTGKPIPVTPSGGGQARTSAAKPATTAAHTANPQSSASDSSVHLGTTAAQLHSMESSVPLVNAEKVAEIRQAISEGRFRINSGVVADRLIETVQDLIKSHKS